MAVLWIALLVGSFVRSLPATYAVRDNDFCAYYDAGKAAGQGRADRLYDPDLEPDHNVFTNLPIISILFVPISRLPYATAWHVFWWCQLLSFLTTIVLLLLAVHKFFEPLTLIRAAGVITIAWMFAPVMRRCLVLGQTTPMIVMLLALFYLLYRSDAKLLSGVVLGGIWLIKIPPLMLLPVFILRRRFKVVLVGLVVLVGAVVLSATQFGVDSLSTYVRSVIFSNAGGAMAAFNNQSLDGALMRFWTGMSLTLWSPQPRPLIVTFSWLIVMGFTVTFLLVAAGRTLLIPRQMCDDRDVRTGSLEIELALATVLMVLIFPVTWIHYYLFLMVPLTLLPFWWEQRQLPRPPWLCALFVVGLCLTRGAEVKDNGYYLAHGTEFFFRQLQNMRPLGAITLLGVLCIGIRSISKRSRLEQTHNAVPGT